MFLVICATDNEKLIDAMKGLKFSSPFGAVEFRAIDAVLRENPEVGPYNQSL